MKSSPRSRPHAGRTLSRRDVRRRRLYAQSHSRYAGNAGSGARPRSDRHRRRRTISCANRNGRLMLVEARVRRARTRREAPRHRRLRRRRPRHRRLLDADRRGRARLFLPLRRSARHAHGVRRAERRRSRQRRGRSSARRHPLLFRRGTRRAPHRQGDRRRARAQAPITTTRALAELIARVAPGRPGDIHPATRSFQALRIAVNDELGEFVQGARRRRSAC